MAEISYLQAIFQAQSEEMERDARVLVMGEGVRRDVYGTTTGFVERFGPERVRDSTPSERGFIGVAGRIALRGGRPVVDATVASFLFPSMDQICSFVAKSRFIYGGQALLPMVIRSCLFYGDAEAHPAERPYPVFMNMPGLKIIAPSNAHDMKGLLKAAIRDDEPVMSFEDATCWMTTGEVPDDRDFLVPLGKGEIRRAGKDVTIVAIAGAVNIALDAALRLQGQGISAEVVDPRTLVPLDREIILRSVRKTGRAICVDPAHETCSAASEIAATIAEQAFDALRAPVMRVATLDRQLPSSPHLDRPLYPSVERIVEAARTLVGAADARSRAA
ncbi:MAG TPA: transketolase C-terminal domain-containing protein [Novosphingobium sp.]|nr:transketolase C-terminal domain-containing protein [Novosphingobium sp.]